MVQDLLNFPIRRDLIVPDLLRKRGAPGISPLIVNPLGPLPYQAPEPLPPIDLEEVTLVVWMGVEAE